MIVNNTVNNRLSNNTRASNPKQYDEYIKIQKDMDTSDPGKRRELIYKILLESKLIVNSPTLAGTQTRETLLKKTHQSFSEIDNNKNEILYPNDKETKIAEWRKEINQVKKEIEPQRERIARRMKILQKVQLRKIATDVHTEAVVA